MLLTTVIKQNDDLVSENERLTKSEWLYGRCYNTLVTLTLYVAVTQFTYGKLRYCYVKS